MTLEDEIAAALGRPPSPDALEPSGGVAFELLTVGASRAAVVSFDRPAKLNALAKASWSRLSEIFTDLAGDRDLHAVVLRGSGGRAFSAGADIAEFPEERLSAERAGEYNALVSRAIESVRAVPAPVIAMVDGLAVGGGCEIALTADICIAGASARFGIPIGRLGVILGPAELRSAIEVLGPRGLMHLAFSGSLLSAERALQLGIVHEVVPDETLAGRTGELVLTIASGSSPAIRATKHLARLTDAARFDPADARFRLLEAEVYAGDELRNRVAAFPARGADRPVHGSGAREGKDA